MTEAAGDQAPRGEAVVDRALRLLSAFEERGGPLLLAQLSARAGLPKPTTLRLARRLVAWGALERTGDGDYVIGLRLLEVASLSPRGHGLRAAALPFMEDLHQATGQHVLLAVRDDREAVLVERLSAPPRRPGALPRRRPAPAARHGGRADPARIRAARTAGAGARR
jgi:DNA-binding IclR family transcriptional regulator